MNGIFHLLWLVPALPCAGFLVLALLGRRLSRPFAAMAGVGFAAASAVLAALIALAFFISPPRGYAITIGVREWFNAGGFSPDFAFFLDPLALIMVLVVTWVSVLILLYSTWFMEEDEGYSRFFAYMNLFVGSMLVLVLADNLLFLYLGWEGVGLCSYLLIGFWYREEANARAAFKAFIVTRIGDTAFAVGLLLIVTHLGTLQIQEAMTRAAAEWPVGSGLAVAAAALLLGGALGKSAQLPLQTWLPDAMAGPTPVSALIHAATMVTAGVYLIARTHAFFSLAPAVLFTVAVIGGLTLLIAASSALVQRDIKRVLAYSTMSQIGFMFLALGVGAWIAAIFHFMIHAFFKALLFLGAGVVIRALREEHDVFKMGGLRRELPLVFWTFLIGCASLSAVPFVTGGFYSKDLILFQVWQSPSGGPLLFLAGLAGGLMTSIYSFRLLFLVFYGEAKGAAVAAGSRAMAVPLVVLAILALAGGFLELPEFFGLPRLFSGFLAHGLPGFPGDPGGASPEAALLGLSSLVSLAGIYIAYHLFLRRKAGRAAAAADTGGLFQRFLFDGWGFDLLYNRLVVGPFVRLARVNRDDALDLLPRGVAGLAGVGHRLLTVTQSGNLRWYAVGVALGAAVFIFVGVVLR